MFTLLIVLFLGSPFSYKVLQLGLNGTGTPKQEKGQKRTTREVRFTVKAYRAQIGLNGHRPNPVPAYTTTRVGLYYFQTTYRQVGTSALMVTRRPRH